MDSGNSQPGSGRFEAQWRQIYLHALCRFLAHFILYLPVTAGAWLVTILVFFPHEHPFDTAGEPDYVKCAAKFSAYAITPAWVILGGLSGLLFSVRAPRRVPALSLSLFAAWMLILAVWRSASWTTEPWPLWMHALCAFTAAAAVCRALDRRS